MACTNTAVVQSRICADIYSTNGNTRGKEHIVFVIILLQKPVDVHPSLVNSVHIIDPLISHKLKQRGRFCKNLS